jgi:hypothetical protein
MFEPIFIYRLAVFFWGCFHLQGLIVNVLQTYDSFNPSYIRHYFQQQCLRPTLGILVALLLWIFDTTILAWLVS